MTGVTDGIITLTLQFYLTGDGHATAITMDGTTPWPGLASGKPVHSMPLRSAAPTSLNAGGTDFNELGPTQLPSVQSPRTESGAPHSEPTTSTG